MSRRGWNIGIIHLFNDVLYEEGLSAETPGLTNGLRYHLIDICIDELAKVNKDAKVPLTEATFLDCIEPFFVLAQRAVDKNVQKRVMDNVLLKFLIEYSFVSTIAIDDDVEDDEKSLIFDQVHVGTVSKFIFQIASDVDTDDRFRKSLYEMHKTYERQIKTAGRDVEDVQYCVEIDDEVNGDDDCGDENNPNSDDMQSSVAGGENGENEAAIDQTSHENDEASKPTTLASTEKKKRKKKKKRDEIATVDSVVDEIADLGDGTVIDISTPRKSSSKKKKRKSDENLKDDNDVEVHEPAPRSEKVEKRNISSITSKSSKKQKMKQDVVPTENHSHLVTSHVETPAPNAKKKKINSPPSVDPRSMHSLDQITSPESDGAGISPSRRVSFGATNQCKSHKASMKAVKTLEKERWDTRRTPEKSILRPRSTEKKKSKSQLTGQSSSRKKRGVRKLDNE